MVVLYFILCSTSCIEIEPGMLNANQVYLPTYSIMNVPFLFCVVYCIELHIRNSKWCYKCCCCWNPPLSHIENSLSFGVICQNIQNPNVPNTSNAKRSGSVAANWLGNVRECERERVSERRENDTIMRKFEYFCFNCVWTIFIFTDFFPTRTFVSIHPNVILL